MFEDIQISGPFRRWKHRHIIRSHEEGAILRDEIEYEPPMAFLGAAMTPFLITPKIDKMFEYRHQVTREWCESGSE
jgi:ligand-binding SRPBCC domain-containing protein